MFYGTLAIILKALVFICLIKQAFVINLNNSNLFEEFLIRYVT